MSSWLADYIWGCWEQDDLYYIRVAFSWLYKDLLDTGTDFEVNSTMTCIWFYVAHHFLLLVETNVAFFLIFGFSWILFSMHETSESCEKIISIRKKSFHITSMNLDHMRNTKMQTEFSFLRRAIKIKKVKIFGNPSSP